MEAINNTVLFMNEYEQFMNELALCWAHTYFIHMFLFLDYNIVSLAIMHECVCIHAVCLYFTLNKSQHFVSLSTLSFHEEDFPLIFFVKDIDAFLEGCSPQQNPFTKNNQNPTKCRV